MIYLADLQRLWTMEKRQRQAGGKHKDLWRPATLLLVLLTLQCASGKDKLQKELPATFSRYSKSARAYIRELQQAYPGRFVSTPSADRVVLGFPGATYTLQPEFTHQVIQTGDDRLVRSILRQLDSVHISYEVMEEEQERGVISRIISWGGILFLPDLEKGRLAGPSLTLK